MRNPSGNVAGRHLSGAASVSHWMASRIPQIARIGVIEIICSKSSLRNAAIRGTSSTREEAISPRISPERSSVVPSVRSREFQ
jgi:hypothetical protein